MSIATIIYIAICTVAFLFAARYDIHMFQLASYRNSRYFRWLWPDNIHTHRKWVWALLFACSFYPSYITGAVAAMATAWYIAKELKERYKTPLVFTNRVKRLYTTTLLLFAASTAITIIVAPQFATVVAGITLLLSNIAMLIANIINTPIEKGVNRHYYNDAKRILESHKGLIIIGVTGSFGKTSTKNYLASLLAEKYNVLVTPGNFNTLLGVIRTVREQLRPYHQVFIVEMGAKQSGDIKEICDLVHPTIGIVTAVGEMHLETFKCVKNIQNTKFELIDSLPANGTGIINIDSELIKSHNYDARCKMIRYAVNEAADYRAEQVEYGANGVSYTISTSGERFESRLLGSGNLLNMLAAIAVADLLEVPVNKQKSAMARLQPVEHRLSMRKSGGITVLDDAYNSNPTGAKMALEVLGNFAVGKENKRIVITPGFVEMGSRQYDANFELGRTIAKSSDYAIVVNATNREAIASGIADSGMERECFFLADSLDEAHRHLATILRVGDVVLYENDLPDNFK